MFSMGAQRCLTFLALVLTTAYYSVIAGELCVSSLGSYLKTMAWIASQSMSSSCFEGQNHFDNVNTYHMKSITDAPKDSVICYHIKPSVMVVTVVSSCLSGNGDIGILTLDVVLTMDCNESIVFVMLHSLFSFSFYHND